MIDDLDSLDKGIFVLPYDPSLASGPSILRPRLGELTQATYRRYEAAYQDWEGRQVDELLDEVQDWVNRSRRGPHESASAFHRLPIGILESPGRGTQDALLEMYPTFHGREATDLASAVKALTLAVLGEVQGKSGRSGLDEIQRWWSSLPSAQRTPIVIQLQEAQLVPQGVLSELIYILTLHPTLPLHLMLSVPSTRTFLDSWVLLDPPSVDLCILPTGTRGKRKGGHPGVEVILNCALDPTNTLHITEELAEALRRDEKLYGGGPQAVLKALKYILLHHSVDSPLAALIDSAQSDPNYEGHKKALEAVVDAIRLDPHADIPGREVLEIPLTEQLEKVTAPAPRRSILEALTAPTQYIESFLPAGRRRKSVTPQSTPRTGINGHGHGHAPGETATSSPVRQSKRRRKSASPPLQRQPQLPNGENQTENEGADVGGDLKEVEIMFNLWKSAGRKVNLWDWLDGFRAGVEGESQDHKGEGEGGCRAEGEGSEARGEEEEDERLHATFVRLVEEGRMLGLVRTRGKGRKADELIKGITLL